MKARLTALFCVFTACVCAHADPPDKNACDYFFRLLEAVPHERLTQSSGIHRSVWDGKHYPGCEVRFVSNDGLLAGRGAPSLEAAEGTELYRAGWRMNDAFLADGPGTGTFGLEKDAVLCIVSGGQPAYLDEQSGEIVQSETLNVGIQCRLK